MSDLRHQWDNRLHDWPTIHKVASNLGLTGSGHHFFCPGCQPTGGKQPELVIHDGNFQCFRCGARGDVVGLVKLARKCDVESAIAWLEQQTGEHLDGNTSPPG